MREKPVVAAEMPAIVSTRTQAPAEEDAMDVKLTLEEGDVLIEILEERDRSLQSRISHIRRDALKKTLQEKESLVDGILRRLEEERTEGPDFSDLWW